MQLKALRTRLRCVGRAVQNGGKFHAFCEAGKKLLNYCLKLMQEKEEYKSTDDNCYLENIYRSKYIPLSPELAEKQANESGKLFILEILKSFIRLVLIGLSG